MRSGTCCATTPAAPRRWHSPVTAGLGRQMLSRDLGDDLAASSGVRVSPARFGLIVVAVALTAKVTAASGPIAFISLVAPQIASLPPVDVVSMDHAEPSMETPQTYDSEEFADPVRRLRGHGLFRLPDLSGAGVTDVQRGEPQTLERT